MRKSLALVAVLFAVASAALASETAETRFGHLSIENDEDTTTQTLFLGDRKVYVSAGGLDIVKTFRAVRKDIAVLAARSGGSGCPAHAVILEITSAKDVRTSPEFGTCSDLIKARLKGESVVVEMPDFIAHPEEASPRDHAAFRKRIAVYTWSNGKLRKSFRPK